MSHRILNKQAITPRSNKQKTKKHSDLPLRVLLLDPRFRFQADNPQPEYPIAIGKDAKKDLINLKIKYSDIVHTFKRYITFLKAADRKFSKEINQLETLSKDKDFNLLTFIESKKTELETLTQSVNDCINYHNMAPLKIVPHLKYLLVLEVSREQDAAELKQQHSLTKSESNSEARLKVTASRIRPVRAVLGEQDAAELKQQHSLTKSESNSEARLKVTASRIRPVAIASDVTSSRTSLFSILQSNAKLPTKESKPQTPPTLPPTLK